MPTIGNNQFPYPNTSDEPNIPGDLQKLALAVDTAIGGGNRLVATLSDLQKIPNTQLFNGMRATVTSDPMAVNNGEYVVSGGAWVSQTRTRVYTGSKIINGTGTSEYTFLSKPDYTAIVGRAPAFGDVIVFTNGDRTAGTFTSAFSAIDNQNNSVNIVFPSNVSGARRINYAIIVTT